MTAREKTSNLKLVIKKSAGFAQIVVVAVLALLLGVSVFVVGQKTGFFNHAAAQSASLPATNPINRRVYLLIFNPKLRSVAGNPTLTSYKNWASPSASISQMTSLLKTASGGRVNFTIATSKEINDQEVLNPDGSVASNIWKKWLKKSDDFYYTETQYLAAAANDALHHNPDIDSYYQFLNDPQLNICGLANSTDPNIHIDELWIYGGPWFGFNESALATSPNGTPGYPYNGGTFSNTSCNRLLPIMGFNYGTTWANGVHNFGHRTEATMQQVYGSWDENNVTHNWDKFALDKAQSPNYNNFGCGSIHYPPNGNNYEYNSTSTVSSYCDDFKNYPNLSDPSSVSVPINCQGWGCTDNGYYLWWFSHLPHFLGTGPDGKLNDWWTYAMDPNTAAIIPVAGKFSNLSANLPTSTTTFNFSYSGVTSSYIVDMSTTANMASDVYMSFGVGNTSPITVTNPQTRWDKYSCGRTLYWRVFNSDRTIKSDIQTGTIICPPVPNGYLYITYTCSDSYTATLGKGANSCKSETNWKTDASAICSKRSICPPAGSGPRRPCYFATLQNSQFLGQCTQQTIAPRR